VIIKIDNVSYELGIAELKRDAEIIYDPLTQGVMLDFSEMDDAVATKYTYSLTIQPKTGLYANFPAYDAFYYDITTPKSIRFVELPFGQRTIAFNAKIKTVSDGIIKRDRNGLTYWSGMSVTFEPVKPQRYGEVGSLFAVNTLPPDPNANYIWLDSDKWDDNKNWIDGR